MAAMNAGGAFGEIPLMNNGTNGATARAGSDQGEVDFEARLNTYIYGFFLKSENYSAARSLLDSGVPMYPNPRDKELNGTDDNVRSDSKDDMDSKRPDDLPTLNDHPTSFLLDWFSCFWDFWEARKSSPRATPQAMNFLSHTQSRIRQEREQHLLRGTPGGMMPGGMENYGQILRLTNGMQMNAADLRHKAMQNNNRNSYGQPTQQQLAAQFANKQQQQQQQQQMMAQQQNQLRRDPSDLDINGRPRTPSTGETAPSPSKRPRLEGGHFNGQQMMPNGRGPPHGLQGQPMMEAQNGNANSVLLHAGIDPKNLSQSQYSSFQQQAPANQQKSIQLYNQNLQRQQRPNMAKPGMPGQGSDMLQAGMDLTSAGAGSEYFNSGMALRATVAGPNPAGSNHALHDYQVQLMLLEQQNKKRLLMARQEQDTAARPEGQPGMPGAQNFAPGMSPSGSRSGPSPGPNEQMKRGTPKMGQAGLPGGGSPMPDGSMSQSRDSPAAMTYNGQMSDMYQLKIPDGMGSMGPNGMRPPPSSHAPYNRPQMNREQIEAVQRQGVGQIQNGAWPTGQTPIMQQQVSQTPQPSQGTPQQRAMPPPTALPTGATSNGRPASPAQAPAPPTPTATPKGNPKAKKNEEKPRKRLPKKAATAAPTPAAAPADTENPPPTQTPATPSTPSHPSSFSNKNDGQHANSLMQAPISIPTSAPIPQSQPESNFVGLDGNDNGYEIGNFSADLGSDMLEGFDFDSFLQNSDDGGFNFDPSALTFANSDAVEAGGGDA